MFINVRMLAFMDGELRPVNVPDAEVEACGEDTDALLERVFYWGQNDFQPLQFCSVSVGDVAHLRGKFYVVRPTGWAELTPAEYQEYEKIPRSDRSFSQYVTSRTP